MEHLLMEPDDDTTLQPSTKWQAIGGAIVLVIICLALWGFGDLIARIIS